MTTTHPRPSQGDERRALSILATFVHETWAGAYSWSELEHKARTALERAGLVSLQDVLALSAALAAPQPSQGANVKVGGSTVYVTNNHRRESNRWWATVYPGFDDDDKRVSVEECDAIARKIADALNAAPHRPVSAEAGKGVALSDEELGRIAYKGFDDYWTEDCAGKDSEAWTASAKAVIAACRPSESVAASGEAMNLALIRKWPEGFQDRLQHVWLDVVSFIPNVKLYDLQRTLAEFGFRMEVYEDAILVLAGQTKEVGKQAAALERMARLDDEMGIEP